MRLPRQLPPFVAFAVGAALFAALALGMRLAAPLLESHGPAFRQVVLKGAMLVISAVLMVAIWRPRRVWGMCAPRSWGTGVILPTLIGALLGAAATAVILIFGFTPMAGIREMGILSMIGAVWFGSTLAEEVFTRGLIQGWMQPRQPEETRDGSNSHGGSGSRILASGLLFGAMHVSLFFVGGNDPRTAATIVASMTLLGLACAWSRERCGSLVGPLLAHFAFNVAGVVGGALTVIVGRLAGVDLVPPA